jgi:hypothetical protein
MPLVSLQQSFISGSGFIVPESSHESYFDPFKQEFGIRPRFTLSMIGGWKPLTLPPVRCGQSKMSGAYGTYSMKPFKKGDIVMEFGGEKIDLNEAKRRIQHANPQKFTVLELPLVGDTCWTES